MSNKEILILVPIIIYILILGWMWIDNTKAKELCLKTQSSDICETYIR